MLFAIRAHVVIERMFGVLNSGYSAENALQSWTKALQILPSPLAVQAFPRPAGNG
jgi:hypothetical protein